MASAVASWLPRAARRIAHDKGQAFIDEHTLQVALDALGATEGT
jgi:hypothetical protein